MLQSFIEDYIWYHAVTICTVAVIIALIVIHHYGSEKNQQLAKQYKT